MLKDYTQQIESLGLSLFFVVLFFFIGMSINDVLKRGNVPKFGRYIVWLVLFLGCAGFVSKELIKLSWEGTGLG